MFALVRPQIQMLGPNVPSKSLIVNESIPAYKAGSSTF